MNEGVKSISLDRTASAYICLTGEQKLPELLGMIAEKKLTLATAESCTGGLIGKTVTDVPGASIVYVGGIISYTNDIKINVLGVSRKTIDEHTEVSAETAREMAVCAIEKFSADIGVSSTGFAGPSGGTKENPKGTVYICVAIKDGADNVHTHTVRALFEDEATRAEIRETSVYLALEILSRIARDV